MTHEARALNIRQDSGVYYLKTSFLLIPQLWKYFLTVHWRSDHGRSIILDCGLLPRLLLRRTCVQAGRPLFSGYASSGLRTMAAPRARHRHARPFGVEHHLTTLI